MTAIGDGWQGSAVESRFKEVPVNHARVLRCFVLGGVLVLGSAGLAFGQRGAAVNFEKVALLKWYAASQGDNAFQVGSSPQGVTFDGANIWVTNAGNDN
jgi:hypothetical protein